MIGPGCTVLLHALWLAYYLPLGWHSICPSPASTSTAEWLSAPGSSPHLISHSPDLLLWLVWNATLLAIQYDSTRKEAITLGRAGERLLRKQVEESLITL